MKSVCQTRTRVTRSQYGSVNVLVSCIIVHDRRDMRLTERNRVTRVHVETREKRPVCGLDFEAQKKIV